MIILWREILFFNSLSVKTIFLNKIVRDFQDLHTFEDIDRLLTKTIQNERDFLLQLILIKNNYFSKNLFV